MTVCGAAGGCPSPKKLFSGATPPSRFENLRKRRTPTMSEPIFAGPPVGSVISETRHQRLVRTGEATPRFLQGVFPFMGRGIHELIPLSDGLGYRVPRGGIAEIVYFRAGNVSDDLIYLALTANSAPLRYFPVGPKADVHVRLVIIESHAAGTLIQVALAASRGVSGTVVVDVGILECRAGGAEEINL